MTLTEAKAAIDAVTAPAKVMTLDTLFSLARTDDGRKQLMSALAGIEDMRDVVATALADGEIAGLVRRYRIAQLPFAEARKERTNADYEKYLSFLERDMGGLSFTEINAETLTERMKAWSRVGLATARERFLALKKVMIYGSVHFGDLECARIGFLIQTMRLDKRSHQQNGGQCEKDHHD